MHLKFQVGYCFDMDLWPKNGLCFCHVWMKLVEIAQRYYFSATFLGYPEKNQQQFASGMNEIKYPTTKQDSTDRNSNDNIHETFSGLLTLYLNSRFVYGKVKITVDHFNFVFSTLRSLQFKDCNFWSCSIDAFLNATLVNTFWNHCVEVYVMFDHNDAGGRAADEQEENSVQSSTKVVLPHKGDIIAFQNIERIWRSCCKSW